MDNPQAFPMATGNPTSGGEWVEGMTLRDYFAGQYLASFKVDRNGVEDKVARNCYLQADAMLKERNKHENT